MSTKTQSMEKLEQSNGIVYVLRKLHGDPSDLGFDDLGVVKSEIEAEKKIFEFILEEFSNCEKIPEITVSQNVFEKRFEIYAHLSFIFQPVKTIDDCSGAETVFLVRRLWGSGVDTLLFVSSSRDKAESKVVSVFLNELKSTNEVKGFKIRRGESYTNYYSGSEFTAGTDYQCIELKVLK